MKKTSTPRKVKITDKVRKAYAERDKSLDFADPENPVLPPEAWQGAVIGKFYRPLKTAVSLRVDNDVLAWLKSQEGPYQTRINALLRGAMLGSHGSASRRRS